MCTTATYDLPRARQEAGRPAATPAMITVPNPAFSRRLTWQISDAALTAATGARRPISRPCRRAVRAAKRYPAAWQATLAQVRAACRLPPPPATHIKRGSFICKNTQKALIALVLHYIALVLHLLMLAWQGDAVALCGALLRPHRAQAAAGRASLAHIRAGGGRRGLEKQFSARNQLRSMLGVCDALRCSEVPKCRSIDVCIMCCTHA